MNKTINNINKSIIDIIDENQLSEEEVQNIINDKLEDYTTKDELLNYQTSSDSTLKTTSKTIVGAINELFQDANSGKQLIADAIGEPITKDSTFNSIIDAIKDIKNEKKGYEDILASGGGGGSSEVDRTKLITFMQNNGYSISGNESFDELIEILRASGKVMRAGIAKVECGYFHAFLLRYDGKLMGFGRNLEGQLGASLPNSVTIPTLIDSIDNVKQIACGEYHSVALKNDGTVWVCGSNERGQLGMGTTSNVYIWTQVSVGTTIAQVDCGEEFTYCVGTNGTMYSTGYNSSGQLGLGNTTTKTAFTKISTNGTGVASVSCGASHVLMRKTTGALFSCGNNYYGQLGIGNTTDKKTFVQVTSNVTSSDILSFAAGESVSFIIQKDADWTACLYACGWHTPAGTYGTSYNTFTKTSSCNMVQSIACGWAFSIMINLPDEDNPEESNMVMGTGSNYAGQLGYNYDNYDQPEVFYVSQVYHGKQASGGERFALLLKTDGTVWITGTITVDGLTTPIKEWTKFY